MPGAKASRLRAVRLGRNLVLAECLCGCFRNLLLVIGRQLLFAIALARDFELPKTIEAKFGSNLLVPKPLH